jgi:RHS repeat-associated protein
LPLRPSGATILDVLAVPSPTATGSAQRPSCRPARHPARPRRGVENRRGAAPDRHLKVEWDFDDRLVRVTKSDGTVVENTYDVDGVLVRTTINGVATDLLVDTSGGLSHVIAEIDGSGAVTVLYVRAGDMLLQEIRGGIAKMYETDGLGSTRSLLDTAGVQTNSWIYEAFGTTLSSTGTSVSPYRFAGERFVGDVGMYQNRARWLDTKAGRFVSVDPASGNVRWPITLHPFVYAAESPVSFVDPAGGSLVEVGATLLAIGGLTAAVIASVNSYKFWRRGSEFTSPAEQKLPEIEAAYGPDGTRGFDEGVEALVYYWWSDKRWGHDAEVAFEAAKDFRNQSLALEQDPRIATAEHYLWGVALYINPNWRPFKAIGAVGESVRAIEPFWMPPTKAYPPSIYTEKGYDWFRRGLDGEGTIMVPIECWQHASGISSLCR